MALREFCGRKVLMAAPPASDTWQAIGMMLDEVVDDFAENVRQIDALYWFYRGDQPILNRKKDIRAEINNRIVEARVFEVVEFKKGYEFSHPIQYTNAGMGDSTPLDILNTYARLDAKEAKDLELAEWRYIAGTAYRLALAWPESYTTNEDDAPYFTASLDPRSAFVVYSCEVGRRPICAGSYAKEKTASGGEQYRIGVYTDTKYFEWVLPNLGVGFATNVPMETRNGIGKIPIT